DHLCKRRVSYLRPDAVLLHEDFAHELFVLIDQAIAALAAEDEAGFAHFGEDDVAGRFVKKVGQAGIGQLEVVYCFLGLVLQVFGPDAKREDCRDDHDNSAEIRAIGCFHKSGFDYGFVTEIARPSLTWTVTSVPTGTADRSTFLPTLTFLEVPSANWRVTLWC